MELPGGAMDAAMKALGTALGTAILAWVGGPLKWVYQYFSLKRMLTGGRRFDLHYNPGKGRHKEISFLETGGCAIGLGRNENEHAWRIRRGQLEILASDGKVYSRFAYDKRSGRLQHTNDTDTRSTPNQFIALRPARGRQPSKPASGSVDSSVVVSTTGDSNAHSRRPAGNPSQSR